LHPFQTAKPVITESYLHTAFKIKCLLEHFCTNKLTPTVNNLEYKREKGLVKGGSPPNLFMILEPFSSKIIFLRGGKI